MKINLKIKLGSIISAVALIYIGWLVVPRLMFWHSGSTPSASEPARENQATPQTAVQTMFAMMYPTPDPNSTAPPVVDRFDEMHIFEGKDLTPDEQEFAQLFWDDKRCGIIDGYITDGLTENPSVADEQTTGDSAVVDVSVTVNPPHATDAYNMTFTFDLKKRGPNWFVYELRVPKAPDGVYNAVKANS